MSSANVRKGMTNAKFNEENSNILFGEIFIIAIGLGLFAQSWWVFGGVFLGLIISLFIPKVSIILMIAFSLCWAVIGYGFGSLFGSVGASIVLSILGLISGLGLHFSALEWAQDLKE